MAIEKFAGMFNAKDFAYGIVPNIAPLLVATGGAAGATTLTLVNGAIVTLGDNTLVPLNTNAPINIGSGASFETVTPSAVSTGTPTIYQGTTVTATFTYAHGTGDLISSGTVGLQEALNYASGYGGGIVIVDAQWAQFGGTQAMINAATIPAGVALWDNRAGQAGGISNVTVALTNTQIKATNSVPTSILPAPGAGNAWDVIQMFAENKSGGTAYAAGGALALYYGTTSAGVIATATIAATFLTSPTVAHVTKVAGVLADTAATSILNTGLVLANPTADFTTGTGTFIVKVAARLVTNL